MRKLRRWTNDEIELMKKHYSSPGGLEFLVEKLNRDKTSIWAKAMRLGLKHYIYLLRGKKGTDYSLFNFSVDILKKSATVDQITDCWTWAKGTTDFGHGTLTVKRKTVLAHRAMFSAAYPEIDITDLNVNHHCDNPGCINPSHLYAGTQAQNVQDCVRRGRHRWQIARQDV